jgi:hypothetical protein
MKKVSLLALVLFSSVPAFALDCADADYGCTTPGDRLSLSQIQGRVCLALRSFGIETATLTADSRPELKVSEKKFQNALRLSLIACKREKSASAPAGYFDIDPARAGYGLGASLQQWVTLIDADQRFVTSTDRAKWVCTAKCTNSNFAVNELAIPPGTPARKPGDYGVRVDLGRGKSSSSHSGSSTHASVESSNARECIASGVNGLEAAANLDEKLRSFMWVSCGANVRDAWCTDLSARPVPSALFLE